MIFLFSNCNKGATPMYRVFYVQKSQCADGYFGPRNRTERKNAIKYIDLDAPSEVWENVRYLIERKMGIHKHASESKTKERAALYSYVEGTLYDCHDQSPVSTRPVLQSKQKIDSGACIIVWRKPASVPPWIPPKFARAEY